MASSNTTGAVPFPRFAANRAQAYVLVSSLHIIVGILMVLVNAAIFTAFLAQKWRRPASVRLTPRGLLALNLVVADTFLGTFIITEMSASRSAERVFMWAHWCRVMMGFAYLTSLGSYIALMNVVVDRYLAIRYTLLYRERMTLNRSILMVTCGWLIPVAGLISAVASIDPWHPGQITCWEIPSVNRFLRYGYVPSLVVTNVCVVVLQCMVLSVLRKYDGETHTISNQVRRYSLKSARILWRVTAPTCVAMICFDVVHIIDQLWISQVTAYMYHAILLITLIMFLMNPIVYSFGTANIRRPIIQLCKDIRNWFNLRVCRRERHVDVTFLLDVSRSTSIKSRPSRQPDMQL